MADSQVRRSDSAILGGALVIAAFLVSFGVLHYGIYTKNLLLDTPLYESYGDAVVHGGEVPYRDFGLEYPPAAVIVFALPSLIAKSGDFGLYAKLFEALMLACGAVASGLVAFVLFKQKAGSRRMVAGTLLAGLAPLALGPVVLSRFDLWPAMLTIAAIGALIADRRRTSFALLALGVSAKLYPLVLFPLALAYVWRRQGRREALIGCGIFAGVVAACFLPFVVASPGGVWASFSDQLSRPLQIESLGASALLVAHQLWGHGLQEVSSHGSDNLVGRDANILADLQSLLGIVLLVSLWIAFARGAASRDRLLRYAAAAVCAFVTVNKVLSPQYLIWLFALVPLVRGRRGALAGALFVAAMVLTQMWFPRDYINLVYGLDARASWFVFARDVTLVALLATLAWPSRSLRGAGFRTVAGLAVIAAGAAAVAAATSTLPEVARHSGLLSETGVASRCGTHPSVPALTQGDVAYELVSARRPRGGSACVTVSLLAAPHVEVFSAAYRPSFDPTDPRSHYLGDAGRCTNVEGLAGRRLSYAQLVPPGARFTVEVESCEPGGTVPSYVIDMHDGTTAPVVYRAGSAVLAAGRVTLRFTTAGQAGGVRFSVYRQRPDGTIAPLGGQPVAVERPGARGYRFVDRDPPLIRPLRYWIFARSAGDWSWYGPLRASS